MSIEIPKEFDKELYITLGVGSYVKGELSIMDIDRTKMGPDSGFEFVLLKTIRVSGTIEATTNDIVGAMVSSLKATKAKIVEEYETKLADVDEQIRDAMALEHMENS